MTSSWNHGLADFLDPAEVAARSLRNKDLRTRILGVLQIVLQILDRWWALLADPRLGNAAPLYVSTLITHVLKCLGAWQRGEDIPTAITDYELVRDSQQRTRERIRERAGLRDRD